MQANMNSGILRRYRWKELGLLVIPFLILLLEMVQLPLAQYFQSQITVIANTQQTIPFSTAILPSFTDLIPVFGLIVALLLVNLLLSIFFPKADQLLLPLVGLMSGIGVLMALRLGPEVGDQLLGIRQLVWVILGLILCMATVFGLRNMNWLKRYKYTWALLGIFLVALTIVNALRVKNLNSPTHDQLNFGPLNLQPSELLKIFIVVFFAGYLSENRDILTEGNLRIGPLRLASFTDTGSDSIDASDLTFAVLSNTRTGPGATDLWYFPEYDIPWQWETFLCNRRFVIICIFGLHWFQVVRLRASAFRGTYS